MAASAVTSVESPQDGPAQRVESQVGKHVERDVNARDQRDDDDEGADQDALDHGATTFSTPTSITVRDVDASPNGGNSGGHCAWFRMTASRLVSQNSLETWSTCTPCSPVIV